MNCKKIVFLILIVCVGTIYQIQSKEVSNVEKYTVVIDPGHGGMDQGAVREQVYEEDINFQVALYLKQLLEANDITVVLTRTTDIDLANPNSSNRKREDLKQRVQIMDSGDVFVSIHMNVSDDLKVKGAQVFYGNEESLALADEIQRQFVESKFSSKQGDYYILKNTSTVGVIVECGFLSNAKEREELKSAKYQEQLAYSICKGILEYRKG